MTTHRTLFIRMYLQIMHTQSNPYQHTSHIQSLTASPTEMKKFQVINGSCLKEMIKRHRSTKPRPVGPPRRVSRKMYRTRGTPNKCFSNIAKDVNNVTSFISLSRAPDVALISLRFVLLHTTSQFRFWSPWPRCHR